MHIVHCLTHSTVGGGQQVVFTLVKTLMKLHPEVRLTVLLPPSGVYVERFKTLNVNVIEFPFDRFSVMNVLRAERILKQLDADVIHSHGKGAGVYVRMISSSSVKAKRVHSYHGFHPPVSSLLNMSYLMLESRLLKNTDGLVMVSNSEAEEVVKYFPASKNKMSVIPNIVVCENENGSLPVSLTNFLNTHQHSFIITMIGRNDPIKNYPLAFRALEQVFSMSNQSVLIVVGMNEQTSMLKRLKDKYPQRVCSVVSIESSIPLLRRSSLLLLTSRKEGCPLTVLEAFCAGKPVVGTNVSGIADVVIDGYNGLLSPENLEQLAETILKLQREQETYARLSAGAVATAKEMNIAAWIQKYYTVYSELLS